MPWKGHSLDLHFRDMVQAPSQVTVAYPLFYFMHLFCYLLSAADMLAVKQTLGVQAMQADLKGATVLGTPTTEFSRHDLPYLRGQFCDVGGIR